MAARDIQPLELILFERPLALGPKFYDTTQKVGFGRLWSIYYKISRLVTLDNPLDSGFIQEFYV